MSWFRSKPKENKGDKTKEAPPSVSTTGSSKAVLTATLPSKAKEVELDTKKETELKSVPSGKTFKPLTLSVFVSM